MTITDELKNDIGCLMTIRRDVFKDIERARKELAALKHKINEPTIDELLSKYYESNS